jgi:hypothetical protein
MSLLLCLSNAVVLFIYLITYMIHEKGEFLETNAQN